MKGYFCLVLVLLFNSAIAQETWRTGKLKNGLTYYIRHNAKPRERADFYLAQHVGSILEEDDQRGLAHFLEHMAFNGTVHFPGNLMTTELEKKGLKGGLNINANTDYDRTVYRLTDVPVARNGMIDTALLVLHDWSGYLTLDEKAIDKERNIVREEWRTRNSGRFRALEQEIFPTVFAGTPYANRVPIGNMDVISNFRPEQLRAYYHKWYRPDLQAVIVIGDVNVDAVEKKIEQLFGQIPVPEHAATRPRFSTGKSSGPVLAMATDKEIDNVSVDLYWKQHGDEGGNKGQLLREIAGSLLSGRYVALAENKQLFPASVTAREDKFLITEDRAFMINLRPEKTDSSTVVNCLRMVLVEAERVRRMGFTTQEFDLYRKAALHLNELDFEDRNNSENMAYTQVALDAFFSGDTLHSDAWKYHTTKDLLEHIALEEVDSCFRRMIPDSAMVMVVMAPSRNNFSYNYTGIYDAVKKMPLAPYIPPAADDSSERKLAALKVSPGKVVKTTRLPAGIVQWSLSNGVKVQYKQTGYDEHNFILFGYRPGGLSQVDDKDLPEAGALQALLNVGGTTDPDGDVTVRRGLSQYEESIAGKTANIHSLKRLFQLTYLKMMEPELQPATMAVFLKRPQTERSVSPKSIFNDTLRQIMSNHQPRALAMAAVDTAIAFQDVLRLWTERFGDAGDFTFFLAGNVAADSVRQLAAMWLGALPAAKRHEQVINRGLNPPRGIVRSHFRVAMKTPQTTITIGYTGKAVFNDTSRVLMQLLGSIFNKTCNEKMRAEAGGTYGVWAGGNIEKYPVARFLFQVVFDCDPAKKEQMTSIVFEQVKNMMQEGPPIELLGLTKENLVKQYREENAEKDAAYWSNKMWLQYVYGLKIDMDMERLISSVSVGQVRSFATQLFNQGNLIEVVMDPN
jgi:zinc protease